MVVSTLLKHISQIGSSPQVGVKKKDVWNHHPAYYCESFCDQEPFAQMARNKIINNNFPHLAGSKFLWNHNKLSKKRWRTMDLPRFSVTVPNKRFKNGFSTANRKKSWWLLLGRSTNIWSICPDHELQRHRPLDSFRIFFPGVHSWISGSGHPQLGKKPLPWPWWNQRNKTPTFNKNRCISELMSLIFGVVLWDFFLKVRYDHPPKNVGSTHRGLHTTGRYICPHLWSFIFWWVFMHVCAKSSPVFLGSYKK